MNYRRVLQKYFHSKSKETKEEKLERKKGLSPFDS